MIIDTHAHYDDDVFEADREELFSQFKKEGVDKIITVSATYDSCKKTIELIETYDFMYGAIGVHPDEVGVLDDEKLANIKELAKHKKVVAIGEIGLDYHWDTYPRDVQKKWFEEQLKIAIALDKPVNVHSRDAAKDTFDIMKSCHTELSGGIIHCYSGSVEMARDYVAMGFMLGIGGVVTFKNAQKLKEVVRAIDLGNLVLETDAPYLAPVPFRGERNHSALLHYVAEEIAKLKEVSKEVVLQMTHENASKLYRL